MLVPSGGACDTMLAAMPPPPPVLFSTVMVWPRRSAILSASNRPMMSGLPPGEVPTRMRSGRCGQFCCAPAGSAELPAKAVASASARRRVRLMVRCPSLKQRNVSRDGSRLKTTPKNNTICAPRRSGEANFALTGDLDFHRSPQADFHVRGVLMSELSHTPRACQEREQEREHEHEFARDPKC